MRITRLHTLVALLLLFAIVVIVIAPSVDLDPTTLRAQQAAMMAMAAVAAAGMAVADVLVPDWTVMPASFCGIPLLAFSGLLDLICTRLC
jgi:hypothetical protein